MKTYENLIPKGWRRLNGTLTEPNGCIWIHNGKSLFEKGENGKTLRKSKVLIVDRELFEENLKKQEVIRKVYCSPRQKYFL